MRPWSTHIEIKQLTLFKPDVGMFLWTAGLTTFLMGVSWGGVIYPWNSPAPISSMVIGVVLLVILFVYEAKMDLEYPTIPVRLFLNRGFISLVCCATIASVSIELTNFVDYGGNWVTDRDGPDVLLLGTTSMAAANCQVLYDRHYIRRLALGTSTHQSYTA